MSEYKDFSDKDITMQEQLIMMHRLTEIYRLFIMCMVVRNGGEVVLKSDEVDYTRRHYQIAENINVEDLTCDTRFRVRLK